ncbi:rhodopsin [Dictyobacter vulcani]|uniref:Rhodopsin n=1 Tax=Dictyobacter vulcani TaxID=2607529 RepID=A0A5J4KXN6_9CHLR|nr:bacteriorhodopsin [Dictyobacter vulcani]GER91280.1 rhodopsin [Dictyobacter vulcani]
MISGTGPLGSGVTLVLWITALIMILGSLYFTYGSVSGRVAKRQFYAISAIITLIAATVYALMAGGYGTLLQQPGGHLVFFGRYIDWTFTTPLLLLDLALLALARNFPNRAGVIGSILVADVYMILTGFVASLIRTEFRWVFFAASCAGFLAVLYFVLTKLMPQASLRGRFIDGHYRRLTTILVVLWILYPVVWALGKEGFGVIPTLAETVCYAVLDVCAKVGFGLVLVSNRDALEDVDREINPVVERPAGQINPRY